MRSTLAARRRTVAFSLVELLTVIAIMSTLACMLLPVFAKARNAARRTRCSERIRQCGLAFLQYIQDYDERLPNLNDEHLWGRWAPLMAPYIQNKEVVWCADDPRPFPWPDWNVSYVYCYALYNTVASINNHITFAPKQTWGLGEVAKPSRKILLWEGIDNHDSHYFSGPYVALERYRTFSFVDGHVKFLHGSQLTTRHPAVRYDPNWTWDAAAGVDF